MNRIEWILTGTPAAHGEDAVAALDSELVEPYLTRLGNECSLNDSDGTVTIKSMVSFRLVFYFKFIFIFIEFIRSDKKCRNIH